MKTTIHLDNKQIHAYNEVWKKTSCTVILAISLQSVSWHLQIALKSFLFLSTFRPFSVCPKSPGECSVHVVNQDMGGLGFDR